MYKVIIERNAVKDVESLPPEFINLIVSAIKNLQDNPRPHGVKKLFNDVGWRIRKGDYRILYTIDDKNKIAAVYRVKHRREVYR